MQRQGPEFNNGWAQAFEHDGIKLRIVARHYNRKRMPRGNEMVKAMARGRPLEMIPDPIYEWALLQDRRQARTIRLCPNGRFELADKHQYFDSLAQLAASVAEAARPKDEPAFKP